MHIRLGDSSEPHRDAWRVGIKPSAVAWISRAFRDLCHECLWLPDTLQTAVLRACSDAPVDLLLTHPHTSSHVFTHPHSCVHTLLQGTGLRVMQHCSRSLLGLQAYLWQLWRWWGQQHQGLLGQCQVPRCVLLVGSEVWLGLCKLVGVLDVCLRDKRQFRVPNELLCLSSVLHLQKALLSPAVPGRIGTAADLKLASFVWKVAIPLSTQYAALCLVIANGQVKKHNDVPCCAVLPCAVLAALCCLMLCSDT